MTVGQVLAKISAGEAGTNSGDAKGGEVSGEAEAVEESLQRESPQSAGKILSLIGNAHLESCVSQCQQSERQIEF